MDAFDKIANSITEEAVEWETCPAYWLFEGWDVGVRSQAVLDQAMKDGAALDAPDVLRAVGAAPMPFQNGYLLSTNFGRVLMAGSQVGKSAIVFMEILMSASGKIPVAYRYPVGYDTGIRRIVSKENIIRWGRADRRTGRVLDHNFGAPKDDSWDCGTVKGLGVFPTEKIVAPSSMIRLASYQSMILQNWWPAFTGESKSQLGQFMPPQFIDKRSGSYANRGFNVQERVVHLPRGVILKMLSYEAERRGLEGIKVPTYLDEEPPKEDIMGALVSHATRWSLSETPWLGLTWSKRLAFPTEVTAQKKTFHGTAYDCPYKTPQDIINTRSELEERPWEIVARIWGLPAEQTGKPYYDRRKINLWIQRFQMPHKLVRFEPVNEWNGIRTDDRISRVPGLLDTPVRMVEAENEDKQSVWRLYEDRQPGVAYASASDQAEGAEVPDQAADMSVAVIGRASDESPNKPVIAATLRSTFPTPHFAREVLYAARYYNNALLAPETGPGSANESFRMVAMDWPWWFKDVTTRYSTRKLREQMGWRPTTDRRDAVFDKLIRDWIDNYDENEYPDIPDEMILRELAAAVHGFTKGKKDRCDHARDGTLDSAMAFGILLFIFQVEYAKQIKCNGGEDKKVRGISWLDRALMDKADEIGRADGKFLGEVTMASSRR